MGGVRPPLLLSILIRPRATMRWILDHRPGRGVIVLVVGAFLSAAVKELDIEGLGQGAAMLGPTMLTGIVLGVLLLIGAIAVGVFFVFAWIAKVTGTWVGGSGSALAIRTALAWGFAPFIWAALYRIAAVIFWPDAAQVLRSEHSVAKIGGKERIVELSLTEAPPYQIAILLVLEFAVVLWYLGVASRALAEAQGISSWRGFGNLVLAYTIPFVALLVIGIAAALTVWSTN